MGESSDLSSKFAAYKWIDTGKYKWNQSLQEANVMIPIPEGTRGKMMKIDFQKTKIRVAIGDQDPILEGEFHSIVKPDDCTWQIDDDEGQPVVTLYIEKFHQQEWWKCFLKGDPEVNTQDIEPEPSKLQDLDGETAGIVKKMMFDQQQKQAGLPSSDELNKQEMMQKFMAAHPEMDFSQAKMQ